MITVELRRAPEGRGQYAPVAMLTILDNGESVFDDPDGLFPTYLHALAAADDGSLRRIHFAQEPEGWARNLASILRAGYLVPVVLRDDCRR